MSSNSFRHQRAFTPLKLHGGDLIKLCELSENERATLVAMAEKEKVSLERVLNKFYRDIDYA